MLPLSNWVVRFLSVNSHKLQGDSQTGEDPIVEQAGSQRSTHETVMPGAEVENHADFRHWLSVVVSERVVDQHCYGIDVVDGCLDRVKGVFNFVIIFLKHLGSLNEEFGAW